MLRSLIPRTWANSLRLPPLVSRSKRVGAAKCGSRSGATMGRPLRKQTIRLCTGSGHSPSDAKLMFRPKPCRVAKRSKTLRENINDNSVDPQQSPISIGVHKRRDHQTTGIHSYKSSGAHTRRSAQKQSSFETRTCFLILSKFPTVKCFR